MTNVCEAEIRGDQRADGVRPVHHVEISYEAFPSEKEIRIYSAFLCRNGSRRPILRYAQKRDQWGWLLRPVLWWRLLAETSGHAFGD